MDLAKGLWGLVLSVALVAATWTLTWRLTPERARRAGLMWLWTWSLKALLTPAALWAVINFGWGWWLQPFMPGVQAAQNGGGPWFPVYVGAVGQGWFLVSSWWAAVTLGWVLAELGLGLPEEQRRDFLSLCWMCFLGLGLVAIALVYLGGWPVLGLAGFAILAPIAGYALSVVQPAKLPPMYARAIAKIKFGKYTEAEWEIIQQLENAEDDFEGWLMMAELYANHFQDLHEAEQAILDICNQPKVTPSQLSVALHRLADWQLQLGENPDGARAALQVICDRLPGTHLAHMAKLRMRQLPGSTTELREQKEARPIPLPALGDHFDEAGSEPCVEQGKAVELANACVAKLRQDPNDVASRERLARLLAEQLGQPGQGIEQLGLLLDMPEQAPRRRAEWTSLVAAWQLKYCRDAEAGRYWLERVRREFPDTPQALAASRRLQLLAVMPPAAS